MYSLFIPSASSSPATGPTRPYDSLRLVVLFALPTFHLYNLLLFTATSDIVPLHGLFLAAILLAAPYSALLILSALRLSASSGARVPAVRKSVLVLLGIVWTAFVLREVVAGGLIIFRGRHGWWEGDEVWKSDIGDLTDVSRPSVSACKRLELTLCFDDTAIWSSDATMMDRLEVG